MSPNKTKVLAGALLLITFLVGVTVGAVGARVAIARGLTGTRSTSFLVRRLDHRLHFTAEQRRQVTEIIGRGQQRVASVWSGVRPAIGREIEATNVEIDRVLTPEQRVEFTKIRMRLAPRRDGGAIRVKHD